MSQFKLSIYTPERRLVEGFAVEKVTLTGSEGQIEILPGHVAMMGTLQPGTFSYQVAGKEPIVGVISTGFFEFAHEHLYVTAETLELKGEVDMERARKAQKLSEETLKDASLDPQQFRKYQLKLQRSLIRQHLGS